ncbi:hypothetical protein GF369_04415 [Candidatus Peregrinibacteria bacterium]|nr:hypothetical protein [Candidatus Peregrinibacteria bacterium]
MDKPKQAEVVTIQEAVEKVKKWLQEKDYKKAKQGCEEILAVEKDNAEVQKLLEEAKKGLGENTNKAPKPSNDMPTPTPPKPSSEKTPPPQVKPEETTKKVEKVMPEQKSPEQEKDKEHKIKQEKAPMPTPESIMKAKEPSKTEADHPVEKKDQANHPKAPAKHSSPLGKIILLIILLGAIAGLVFAFLQGWLNPAFDWLLNLLGL